MDNKELAIYSGIALYAAKEFLVPLIKGSFGRNIQAVDKHTEEVNQTLKEHTKEISELKSAQTGLSTTLSSELGNIGGQLKALDTRIAKQGEFHDQKLTDALANLATEFNRKLAQTLNTELERTVREVLTEMLPKKGRGR